MKIFRSILIRVFALTLFSEIFCLSEEVQGHIRKYGVPEAVGKLLDEHRSELELMMKECSEHPNKRHCPRKVGVRRFSWLPGYFVKYGVFRVQGAHMINEVIKHAKLNLLMVPQKYYYHLPGKPEELADAHYFVIAEEIKSDKRRKLTKDQAQQLLVLIEKLLLRDVYTSNALQAKDGRIALIDTGRESFGNFGKKKNATPLQELFRFLALLINKAGHYVERHMIEREAYEYVVDQLAAFIEKQPDKTWYYEYMYSYSEYIETLAQPWPWDYKAVLKKHNFITESRKTDSTIVV